MSESKNKNTMEKNNKIHNSKIQVFFELILCTTICIHMYEYDRDQYTGQFRPELVRDSRTGSSSDFDPNLKK